VKERIMAFRKRIAGVPSSASPSAWLPLEALAEVSVSSEDPHHPIETALSEGAAGGWRAAAPGEQSIGLHFDQPCDIRLIDVVVEEAEQECVQEFAIQWSADRGRTWHVVVRQQFSFSPSGAIREIEHYTVNLRGLTDLTLTIRPDLGHRLRVATLTRLAFQ
jgi:hypothetical protein